MDQILFLILGLWYSVSKKEVLLRKINQFKDVDSYKGCKSLAMFSFQSWYINKCLLFELKEWNNIWIQYETTCLEKLSFNSEGEVRPFQKNWIKDFFVFVFVFLPVDLPWKKFQKKIFRVEENSIE